MYDISRLLSHFKVRIGPRIWPGRDPERENTRGFHNISSPSGDASADPIWTKLDSIIRLWTQFSALSIKNLLKAWGRIENSDNGHYRTTSLWTINAA